MALRDWKEVLCYVVADIHRQELQNRGFGDGRCAFAIHLPVFVLNGHQHTLRITAEDVDWELPGGRINFDEKAARALVEVIAPWRADVARIDGALAKLDQLIDRAEKSQDRSSLLDRAREWLTREK